MPSMGEQKDTWGKRNGAAPILGGGGGEEGEISLRDRSRCHDQKQPRTSQHQVFRQPQDSSSTKGCGFQANVSPALSPQVSLSYRSQDLKPLEELERRSPGPSILLTPSSASSPPDGD